MTWTPEELRHIDAVDELHIAGYRSDGTLGKEVPIWAVTAGDTVYVRTWQRRNTGWFGQAVRSQRARIRVPGLQAEVTVEDVAAADRSPVDGAYRAKYARYGGSVGRMVSGDAVATTLRLSRAETSSER